MIKHFKFHFQSLTTNQCGTFCSLYFIEELSMRSDYDADGFTSDFFGGVSYTKYASGHDSQYLMHWK